MRSFLDFEGVYDPKRMFAVTNWSDEDYTANWRDDTGDNFYILHVGEVKTYPQYLAYYITRNFVDREMFKAAAKTPKNADGSPSRQQERLEMAVNNPEARKPYEDKTIQEIRAGEESPELTAMRAKVRAELIVESNLTSEMHNKPDGSEEFASVPKKAGRPKKVAA
jgi:hypothetical protein